MLQLRHAAALAVFSLVSAPRADELAQRLEPGAVLVRTFESGGSLRLSEVMIEVQGEEHPQDELPDVTIDSKERVVVTDEVAAAEDGRARRVRRTFDEVVDETTFTEEEEEVRERETELAGEAVVFAWDAEEEEWSAKAESEELDADLLEGLRADLSFAEFLPPGKVEEGATWSVPVSAFELLFAPLGELHMTREDDPEPEQRVRVAGELVEGFEGKISATYAGQRDEDGVQVGVIELEIEVESAAEISAEEDSTRSLRFTRELEGELLWHLAEGRMHSLRVDGEGSETVTTEGTFEAPDGTSIEVVQRQTFSGTRTYRFTVEKR